MQKHFLKFRKVFTNIACPPLILIANNSELAAKFLPNEVENLTTSSVINNTNNHLFQDFDARKEKNFFIAENTQNKSQEVVLISEIIIKGWENHPEGRKLELAAYDSMTVSYTHLTLPTNREV